LSDDKYVKLCCKKYSIEEKMFVWMTKIVIKKAYQKTNNHMRGIFGGIQDSRPQ